MKEKIKVLVESSKKVLKNAVVYAIIVCAAVASFFVGIYYNKTTTKKEKPTYQVTKVLKALRKFHVAPIKTHLNGNLKT